MFETRTAFPTGSISVFDPNRAYISDCKFIEHYKNEILKLNMKFFLLLFKEFFSNMFTPYCW